MKKTANKFTTLVLLLLISSSLPAIAVTMRYNAPNEPASGESYGNPPTEKQCDLMPCHLPKRVTVQAKDNDRVVRLTNRQAGRFAALVAQSRYDKWRSESGVMFKMIEQDYIVVVKCPKRPAITLAIWNDTHIKTDSLWYIHNGELIRFLEEVTK